MMDLGTGGAFALFFVVAVGAVIGAMAPIFYAARSGDRFTFVVCVVALAVCVGLLFESRTGMDRIVVAIIYLSSAIVAVVVYAASRISAAIGDANGGRNIPGDST